jgi:hypothetical protein
MTLPLSERVSDFILYPPACQAQPDQCQGQRINR